MYFGYFFIESNTGSSAELALYPDKVTTDTQPIPISKLKITNCALIFIGSEETVKVDVDQRGGTVITAVRPAKLYLTPNRPEKPGLSVNKICINQDQLGQDVILYDRERGWEEFTPNKKDY